MNYYLAGYYLLKTKPIDYGEDIFNIAYTASSCINNGVLDNWSYSWTSDNDNEIDAIKALFKIDNESIASIREWVDNAFNNELIGWQNIFRDLATLKEYITFFPNKESFIVLSLYFSEINADELILEFSPKSSQNGRIGMELFLSEKRIEQELDEEKDIGFDLIGIEISGDFHSFYCHNVTSELLSKFHFLHINKYGLFNKLDQQQIKIVEEYANMDNTEFEPVSWFMVKTKLVDISK